MTHDIFFYFGIYFYDLAFKTVKSSGLSVPIPLHSQTREKSAYLVTLETNTNTPSKHYHTYKRIK